jgi:hypothetical protein
VITIRFLQLLRDIRILVLINKKVLKINKNVYKIKSKKLNRAVRSPLGNLQTVKTNVSNGLTRNSNENEETYWEKRKAIRVINA